MYKVFPLLIILLLTACASIAEKSSDKSLGYKGASQRNVFGYSTPQEALSDLKRKTNHSVRTVIGDHGEWQIIQNNVNNSIWSFTPEQHPAHPSVIRRKVYEKDGSVYIRTEVRCGASKAVCDMLVKDFLKLDEKIKNEMATK